MLKLLTEGKCQKEISKALDFAPSVINYHVKILLKNEHIREIKITKYFKLNSKTYSLTDKGKTLLLMLNSTFSHGGEGELELRPRWALHHVEWKYQILKDYPIHMPIEVDMNNWILGIDPNWKYCTIKKTSSSVIIHVKEIFGNDLYELELRSRNIADTMINLCEGHYGMEFGRPVRSTKPHFVSLEDDDTWDYYKQFYHFETSSGIMDQSPPKGHEFTSLESAINHDKMGDNVKRVLNNQIETNNLLRNITKLFNEHFDSQKFKPLPETDEKIDVV